MISILLWMLIYCLGYAPIICAKQKEPTFVFAHGLVDSREQAETWKPFCEGNISSFDFPDAHKDIFRYIFPYTSLGQGNEINSLKNHIEMILSLDHTKKCMLGGISRGAVTSINYLALHKPKQITACILESPYDSMSSVIEHMVESSRLKHLPYAKEICKFLLPLRFWKYSHKGPHPIDVVDQIDPDIPLLFISKRDDYLVPGKLTERLVQKLRASGHKKVHHLQLDKGSHGNLIKGEQGKLYQDVVHAFYRHYGLPHNADCAARAQELFSTLL